MQFKKELPKIYCDLCENLKMQRREVFLKAEMNWILYNFLTTLTKNYFYTSRAMTSCPREAAESGMLKPDSGGKKNPHLILL